MSLKNSGRKSRAKSSNTSIEVVKIGVTQRGVSFYMLCQISEDGTRKEIEKNTSINKLKARRKFLLNDGGFEGRIPEFMLR